MAKRLLDASARVAINNGVDNVVKALKSRVKNMINEGRKPEEIIKYLGSLEIGVRMNTICYSKAKRNVGKDVRTAEEIRKNVNEHVERWFLPIVVEGKKEQFTIVMQRILENEDIISYLSPKKSRITRAFHVTNLYHIICELGVSYKFFGDDYLGKNKAELIRDAFEPGTTLNNFTTGLNKAPIDSIKNIVKNCCY